MRRLLEVSRLTRPQRIRCRSPICLPPAVVQIRAAHALPAPKPDQRSDDYYRIQYSSVPKHEQADYQDALEAQRLQAASPGPPSSADRNVDGVSAEPSGSARKTRTRTPKREKLPSLTNPRSFNKAETSEIAASDDTSNAGPSRSQNAAESLNRTTKGKGKSKLVEQDPGQDSMKISSTGSSRGLRRNAVGVQLLSPALQEQLFPGEPLPQPPDRLLRISKEHLRTHGLSPEGAAILPEVNFEMPPLRGQNVREHFHALGRETAEPYLGMAEEFVKVELPPMPEVWEMQRAGWTRYGRDGSIEAVKDLGDESIVCFDVETLYKLSPYPVMACAATPNAWYSWLSPTLFEPSPSEPDEKREFWDIKTPQHHCHDLIPLFSSDHERIVIGHNVGYDRQRIKEEYDISGTSTRFLDTLSLHVATRGITSVQRPAWLKYKKTKLEKITHDSEARAILMEEAETDGDQALMQDLQQWSSAGDSEMEALVNRWEDVTSVNSLAEVAALHCKIPVDKSIRDIFGDEAITHASQLRPDLHKLLTYCATDVKTTHEVYKKVFPLFQESCPHPATFAGVLSMGSAFLPVDENWERYLKDAETKYREMDEGVRKALKVLAEKLRKEGKKEGDVWAEQLDWTPKNARWADPDLASQDVDTSAGSSDVTSPSLAEAPEEIRPSQPPAEMLPAWYAPLKTDTSSLLENKGQRNLLPLLLRMKYKSHPVILLREHLWCFMVPEHQIGDYVEAHGEPVHLGQHDGHLDTITEGHAIFRISGPSESRKTKLTGVGAKSMVKKVDLTCLYPELLEKLVQSKPDDVEADLRGCVDEMKELGKADIWGSQLDWSPVSEHSGLGDSTLDSASPTSKGSSKSKKQAKASKGTWPKWYYDLTAPSTSDKVPFGELDLTIKKTAAPLLLRLQWQGYPLVYSKEHKWLYRVPLAKVDDNERSNAVSFSGQSGDERLQQDGDHLYCRLPHKDGEGNNVGNPLSKSFVKSVESGELASAAAEEGDDVARQAASDATNMNVLCSYWISSRERIKSQMVVYQDGARTKGMILPQVITMGTVTRRAVEATWLTASNAKKNRVGSELKAMVRAPPGYAIVGADVDSEELWISSVMGDSQFGCHGATAIGWMTLEGTKSAGTDLHSKTANILGISRDAAKVFNYSRIYGAGQKHAVQLLLQGDATLTKETAADRAKELYKATKGSKAVRGAALPPAAIPTLWHGGSESFLFNTLEAIALSDRPTTPALGCGVTKALRKSYLEEGSSYLPSRINWVVQSSGVDYLHLLIVSMSYLIKKYDISARYLISVHDEVRYLAKAEDRYRCALALQIANAWTRALFCYNLGMSDMPQGVAFFSAVDVDHVLRKEVFMTCETPSHPSPIPMGESFDIAQILEKTGGGDLGSARTSTTLEDDGIGREIMDAGRQQPVQLFPDLTSDTHRLFLEAQASGIGAPAKRWLTSQAPLEGYEGMALKTAKKVVRTYRRGGGKAREETTAARSSDSDNNDFDAFEGMSMDDLEPPPPLASSKKKAGSKRRVVAGTAPTV